MNAQARNIVVTLTPNWQEDTITALGVRIVLEKDAVCDGELFSIYERIANRCFNSFVQPITITDASGEVEYIKQASTVASYILQQRYVAQREIHGDVQICYTLAVEEGQVNPVFDFGNEPGGAVGCGMTILPRFAPEKLHVQMCWDLSALPEGCSAVWTYGVGDCEADVTSEAFHASVFTVGRLRWVSQDNYCFAWIHNPALDGDGIGKWMADYVCKASAFFEDDHAPYVIVTRSKVYTDNRVGNTFGGTALNRSYIWIYDRLDPPSVQQLRHLFPHEAIHNWVTLGTQNDPFGLNTWYVEGMAEYYSAVLPFRFGLIDTAVLKDLLNSRCRDYFQNSHIHTPNMECGKLLFQDPDATRIPYQRGFFYIAAMDAKIRKATNGEHSVDDVVLEILRRQRQGEICSVDTWVELTSQLVERNTREEYEQMAAGAVQIPCADLAEGALRVRVSVDEAGETNYTYEEVNT